MLKSLHRDARDFAQSMKEELNSFHFLLSFFTVVSEPAVLFEDRRVSASDMTEIYKTLKKEAILRGGTLKEESGILLDLEKKILSLLGSPDQEPSPLHFLCAVTGERKCIANMVLDRLGILSDIRRESIAMLAHPVKRVEKRIRELQSSLLTVHKSPAKLSAVTKKQPDNTAQKTEKSPSAQESGVSYSDAGSSDIMIRYGRNLTQLAGEGKLEQLYGRESEIDSLFEILLRKNNNNPCLIGPSGSGKTALVHGLAGKQKEGVLKDCVIWELNLTALVSGTETRGSLEKRISEIIFHVESARGKIIVFIDDIHQLHKDQYQTVSTILKPVLAKGNFPLIGATTNEEYIRFITQDPAFERRFTLLPVNEPEGDELFNIVLGVASSLSAHHGVVLSAPDLVKNAIWLSNRYFSGKSQPDKTLSLLDSLGSVCARTDIKEAARQDLTALVAKKTGIQVEYLLLDGAEILRRLPGFLGEKIVGQEEAKRRITRMLARRFNRKINGKPIASFMFAGPTGVGKTETAKQLAGFFFGSDKRITVFDMSEFQEQHSVSRLIGSPPGYTGYEEGGRLTETFRREPYQLLLLDEIEKAHPKVLSVLLQVLEEGRLTDSRGFTASMAECIIVMTTNLGAEEFTSTKLGFGGGSSLDRQENAVIEKIGRFLSPELLNRIDEIVLFHPFSENELLEIAEKVSCMTVNNLKESYGVDVDMDSVQAVAAACVRNLSPSEQSLGARALKRVVEKKIESAVLDAVTGKEFTRLRITADKEGCVRCENYAV